PMASSDGIPGMMPAGDGSVPPGKEITVGQRILDGAAQIAQSMSPIKRMSQHACTFAIYSHDTGRQIQ
ncbi:hypothetical protein M569_11566, partial [Genlisea aurea]